GARFTSDTTSPSCTTSKNRPFEEGWCTLGYTHKTGRRKQQGQRRCSWEDGGRRSVLHTGETQATGARHRQGIRIPARDRCETASHAAHSARAGRVGPSEERADVP